MKVLLIDDINANLAMMQRLLKANGYEAVSESSPLKALNILANDQSFDAIIVDYMMPEIKGNEFIQLLRLLPCYKGSGTRPVPPCILITAWSQEFTVGDALNLGFYSVLKKPFPNQELLDMLSDIASGNIKHYKNIMFVNYDINDKVLFSRILSQIHYRYVFCASYEEAIEYYADNNGGISAIVLREDDLDNDHYKHFIKNIATTGKTISNIQQNTPPIIITTSSEETFDQADNDPFIYFTFIEPLDTNNFINVIRDMHQEAALQTVLVVDDIGMDIMFLEKIFKKWNYQVLTSSTTEQSLNLLSENRDIAMVICDILTTNINGYELYMRYKSFYQSSEGGSVKKLPFIIVTDSEDEVLIQKARKAGLTEIIRKPLSIGILKQAMKQASYLAS